MTTITGALFDREAQTNARFQLGEVTLSNGDKFYGPREQASTSSFGSPGRFIDGKMSAFDMRPTNYASALQTVNSYMSIWEFYYVPQLPTHVNECIIYINASTGNLTHWVHSIDVVDGNTLVPVTNTNNELPLMFSEHNVAATQINYAVVDGGLKITFDAVQIDQETPIKLTLAQNNDSMYIADIQFGFDEANVSGGFRRLSHPPPSRTWWTPRTISWTPTRWVVPTFTCTRPTARRSSTLSTPPPFRTCPRTAICTV